MFCYIIVIICDVFEKYSNFGAIKIKYIISAFNPQKKEFVVLTIIKIFMVKYGVCCELDYTHWGSISNSSQLYLFKLKGFFRSLNINIMSKLTIQILYEKFVQEIFFNLRHPY